MTLSISAYQSAAARTDRNPPPSSKGLTITLLGLASEAADLLSEYKKVLRDGQSRRRFRAQAAVELGDVLWYAASTATHLNLQLEDLARRNLIKTNQRFGGPPGSNASLVGRYDRPFPASERLPRRLNARFAPVAGPTPTVKVLVNGRRFGSRLNDNTAVGDGYRFHDALHIGLAACLGWSPVLREYLNRKRRSVPQFDETEDGGRAFLLEEALVALIHHYGSLREDLTGIKSIDSDFLNLVCGLVATLEVGDAQQSDWEAAILASYRAFRELREAGQGWIVGDLDARTVRFAGRSLARPPRSRSLRRSGP